MLRCLFLLAGISALFAQPPSTKLWFRGIPMTAEYINGEWTVGDMILDAPSISFDAPSKTQNRAATLYLEASARWPGNVIPYEIAPGVPSRSSDIILRGIEHWNQKTPIRLVRHTTEADYVVFGAPADRGLCSSRVGRVGGAQVVNIGEFCGYGSVIHEIGHVVGFFHEHQRTDRDRYIKIDSTKVPPGFNFDANYGKTPFGRDFGFYDYRSAMHYIGDEIQTIPYGIPVDSEELSAGDIDAVERLVQRPRTAHTIESNPAGLQLLVDGRACTSPCRFTNWSEGSTHTIAAPPTQPFHGRTLYFARWNDDGAQSHAITAALERGVYTASFVNYQPNTLADGRLETVLPFVSSFAAGTSFSVSVNYSNDGGADLPASSIGFFFTTTATAAATSGIRVTGACPTDLLRPGDLSFEFCSVRVPDSIRQGEYFLSAVFDPDARLTEQRRDNNTALAPRGPFFVRGVNGKADLTLSSLTATSEARPGESIAVTASIANLGAASTAFRIGYFFSQQPTRSGASIPSSSVCAVTVLAQRASTNCAARVTIPAAITPGPWYLIAVVDDLDQVAEEDETNNTRVADSGQVIVRAPLPARLEVTAVTAPARGVAGKTLRVETRIGNTGGSPSEPVTIRFRFRSATEAEAPFLQAESVCVVEAAIAPQSAVACAQDVALPESVVPGWWFAFAVIDGAEPVASGAILLGATDQADLFFSAISLPAKFTPGAPQAIRIEITNQGTAAAGPFRAVYQLAGAEGQNISAGLACEAPAGLAVGASIVCTNPVVFPEGFAGKGGLVIVIDDEDIVAEIDEFNNQHAREIEVGA